MNDLRIPVTIISGFLGSGKTTLLNKLIQDNPDRRFAIIENEFGEIGIDNELVIGAEDGIFELSNGCVCCSLNDELIKVLQKLVNSNRKIDNLVVETTGIADPGAVVMSFLSDFQIQSLFRLDAVVTLCDVQFIEQQLESQMEACKQVAIADIILLNKVDKADSYQKDVAKNIIRRMNSHARIFETSFGVLMDINLLNVNAFSKDKIQSEFNTNLPTLTPIKAEIASGSLLKPKINTTIAQLHSDIVSVSFAFDEPLDVMRFDIWLRLLLNVKTLNLFRVKGILNMQDLPEKLILQAVNNQYMTEGGGSWGNEIRQTRIVFIGKNIKRDVLAHGINLCIATDAPFDPAEFFTGMREFEQMIG